VFMLLFLNYIK